MVNDFSAGTLQVLDDGLGISFQCSIKRYARLTTWLILGVVLVYCLFERYQTGTYIILALAFLSSFIGSGFSYRYISRIDIYIEAKTVRITTRIIPWKQRIKSYRMDEVKFIRAKDPPSFSRGLSKSTLRLKDAGGKLIGDVSSTYLFWHSAEMDEIADTLEKYLPPGSGSIAYLN